MGLLRPLEGGRASPAQYPTDMSRACPLHAEKTSSSHTRIGADEENRLGNQLRASF